jgi:hypothetical protein
MSIGKFSAPANSRALAQQVTSVTNSWCSSAGTTRSGVAEIEKKRMKNRCSCLYAKHCTTITLPMPVVVVRGTVPIRPTRLVIVIGGSATSLNLMLLGGPLPALNVINFLRSSEISEFLYVLKVFKQTILDNSIPPHPRGSTDSSDGATRYHIVWPSGVSGNLLSMGLSLLVWPEFNSFDRRSKRLPTCQSRPFPVR